MVTSSSTPTLGNDGLWELLVNDDRALVRTRPRQSSPSHSSDDDDDNAAGSTTTSVHKNTKAVDAWTILSHAVLNGGKRTVWVARGSSEEECDGNICTAEGLQILNHTVPADYDGISTNPQQLLIDLMNAERRNEDAATDEKSGKQGSNTSMFTVGLMTAASMKTLRVATGSASDANGNVVVVDAIVTAGISNARAAGADADVFTVSESKSDDNQSTSVNDASPPPPPGTINSIILIDACLDENTALAEAYAVAVEAKCKAMSDLGIRCGKNPNELANGTGTDSAVLVCRAASTSTDGERNNKYVNISYAGKHTILGELIGQAVYQATTQAVLNNLEWMFRQYPNFLLSPHGWYGLHSRYQRLRCAVQEGHRPMIPSQPMQPVPWPNEMNLMVGLFGLAISYALYLLFEDQAMIALPHNWKIPRPTISVLLAAWVADRFLGSLFMPLAIHPVVKVGRIITLLLSWIPESCFDAKHQALGFCSGCLLFAVTTIFSIAFAWCVLSFPILLESAISQATSISGQNTCSSESYCQISAQSHFLKFTTWFLQVFLVRGSLSLQLLCSVARQMVHFLERGQLQSARLQLCWLCSRDSSTLGPDELAGATLESLSENLSDSLTSPLFFYLLFGPIGAFAFRVVNTLDSRVGYRGRMEWVGKCSARVDDVLNLLPARLTAALYIMTASLCNRNVKGGKKYADPLKDGLRIAWRDASQCESPNAGWPMATLAGLLGVKLEKRDCYCLNGPPPSKSGSMKHSGEEVGRSPNHHDIRRGLVLTEMTGSLLFVMAILTVVATYILNQ